MCAAVELSPVSRSLRDALVAVYPPYVERRLAELGIEPTDEVSESVEVGRQWLIDELSQLLAVPYPEQTRGPLEVFQEAMRFPTAALEVREVVAPARDEVAVRAIPGDIYDLAPASSSALGETVWRAHIAWGAEKAAAMTGQGG